MSFEIKLSWIEDKLPLLKEIDVNRLSGLKKIDKEEIKVDDCVGGLKR